MAAAPIALGFKIAMANAAGVKTDAETTLNPAPTKVEYPRELVGSIMDTADGRVVIQQPNKDPRRRSWLWVDYPASVSTYERQYKWMEGLRSRVRQANGQGAYVYVYDGSTRLLVKRRTFTAVVSAHTDQDLTIPDFGETVHPDTLREATVDVVPGGSPAAVDNERYTIMYSTGVTNLHVTPAPAASLVGYTIRISWLEPDWFKARVVETSRTLKDDGGPIRYTESRFTFVIEDTAWTELG